jgi:ribonuclease P protein component
MKMSLKNKKEINKLFESGKSVSSGVIFAKFSVSDNPGFVFAVSSKKFKRAVDRNRIKRLMRESVKGMTLTNSVALVFIGSKIPSFIEVDSSIKMILKNIK